MENADLGGNAFEPPTVVIDNGTGYSKMGYAGNVDPSYIIPSTIATSLNKVSTFSTATDEYFCNYNCRKTPNSRPTNWIIILVMKHKRMRSLIKLVIY